VAVGHECSVKKGARLMKPNNYQRDEKTRGGRDGVADMLRCLSRCLLSFFCSFTCREFLCVCVWFYSVFTSFALLLLLHIKLRNALSSLLSFPYHSIKNILLLRIIAHLSRR